MKAISLFASAGIGNMYLNRIGIDVVIANELLDKRGEFYKYINPNTKLIIGNIRDESIKNKIKEHHNDDIELLIATPPCQGMSLIGKNKSQEQLQSDERNYLIFDAISLIEIYKYNYVLIENVPRFLNVVYTYDDKNMNIIELLQYKFGEEYIIESDVLNVKDYGIAQSRPRAVIRMHKKYLSWGMPKKQDEISIKEAIGHLPSLESGEKSDIKYHYARKHIDRHTSVMKYTPTGCSAFDNEKHYPKKDNGDKAKGFSSTYCRMKWDKPAPAITMRSDAISSQQNVHPGRKLKDGTYSDARVLTLLEIFILFSIDEDVDFPDWASDTFIRQIIGEAVPPLFMNKILKGIVS